MSFRLPPLEVLATFPTPNYTNPVTHGSALTVVNAVFLGLATIMLAGRLVSRGFINKWLGLDDLLICMAYIVTVGIHIVLNLGVECLGWDRHIWDVKPEWIEGSLKNVYAGELLFLVAAILTALSLITFYYRISQDAAIPWFKWTLNVAVFVNITSWLSFFLIAVFQCRPINAFWTWPPPENARCIDPMVVVFGGGVVKVFVDITIATLPIPLVLRLKLSRRRKLAVVFLLALGYVVTIAGAVRTYYSHYILRNTYDETWYNYYAFLAATVENDLAIVCACAPTLRPLFRRLAKGMGAQSTTKASMSYQTSAMSRMKATVIRRPDSQESAYMSPSSPSSKPKLAPALLMPPTDDEYAGQTFWRTTMNNDSEEYSLSDLRGQDSQVGFVWKAGDVEKGVYTHWDDLEPLEGPIAVPYPEESTAVPHQEGSTAVSYQEGHTAVHYQEEETLSRTKSRESTFRTWHIEKNPFPRDQ